MTLVIRSEAAGVVTLTLNRPRKRNALDIDTFVELDRELAAIEASAGEIGAVVLRANGPVFCAGADLGVPTPPPVPNFQAQCLARLSALPQPVIAAVHADCCTGGLELILAADIIVAAESARFADTHARWGVMPGWGLTQRLPRRIGIARAKLMAFSTRLIDARTAERWGLVDLCHADAMFDAEVDTLAHEIAAQSHHCLGGYKRLFAETADLPLAPGLAWEIDRSPGKASDFGQRMAGRFGRGA